VKHSVQLQPVHCSSKLFIALLLQGHNTMMSQPVTATVGIHTSLHSLDWESQHFQCRQSLL